MCIETEARWEFSRNGRLPIRVIDIAATLRSSNNGGIWFAAPAAWNFFVISHTWSKLVRDLSDEIGELICGTGRSYDDAFREQDLRSNACYSAFTDFLRLLQRDGVEHVWMDAICINQKDPVEKSVEISRMGAYYSNSLGCYVLINGIGRSYDAWSSEIRFTSWTRRKSGWSIKEPLPRWFRRAWTLQEFLLSAKLTFVVAVNQWSIQCLNACIALQNAEVGFCRCCLITSEELLKTSRWKSADIIQRHCGVDIGTSSNVEIMHASSNTVKGEKGLHLAAPQEEGNALLETNQVCHACKSLCLIRSAGGRLPSTGNVYFVDRDAYISLISIARWTPPDHHARPPSEVEELVGSGFDSVCRLFSLLARSSNKQLLWPVLEEIFERDCTVEEDKILSILGLLGVDGIEQLRTGKKLEEQIVEVAKVCKSDMLIQLCSMNCYGNDCGVGLSWVPRLTRKACSWSDNVLCTWQMSADRGGSGNRALHCLAEVVRITEQGITFAATIVHAEVVPSPPPVYSLHEGYGRLHVLQVSSATCCDCNLFSGLRLFIASDRVGALVINLIRVVHVQNNHVVDFEDVGQMQLVMKGQRRYSSVDDVVEGFDIWLVLLGKFLDSQGKEHALVLPCISKDEGESLHKIGVFSFPLSIIDLTAFGRYGCNRQCLLGGFGKCFMNGYVRVGKMAWADG